MGNTYIRNYQNIKVNLGKIDIVSAILADLKGDLNFETKSNQW